eukprot:g248.t1
MGPVVPFTAHVNKATNNVQKLKWSPVNDLVAVIFDEPSVTLYRLPWQRVWTHMTDISPVSLCWSPDGNRLAVGFENGVITILAKEDGSIVWTIKDNSNPVLTFDWVDVDDDQSPNLQRFQNPASQLKKLFNEVPTEVPTQPMSVIAFYKKLSATPMEHWNVPEADEEHPSVLIAARRAGSVCCYLQGRVLVLKFNSSTLLNNPNKEEISIDEVSITNDLSAILVLQSFHPVPGEPGLAANATLQLLLCDAQCLALNLKKVQDLSLRLIEIIDFLDMCEHCLSGISKSWSAMMLNLKNFITLEEVSLEDLTDELILFTGLQMMTKSLEIFCNKKWSHAEIQCTTREMDSTLRITDEVLTNSIQIQIQKAILVAEDLHYLIESSQMLMENTLGIQVTNFHSKRLILFQKHTTNKLRVNLKWSLVRVEMIQKKLNSMGKQYRLFMCLLLLVQQTHELGDVSDSNVTSRVLELLDFLESGLFKDPIGSEFELEGSQDNVSSLIKELRENKEFWIIMCSHLGDHPEIENQPGLRNQLLQCRELAHSFLTQIKNALSQQITLKQKVNLGGGLFNPVDCAKLKSYYNPDTRHHQFLVLLSCLEGRLRNRGVASIMVMKGTIEGCSETLMMKLQPSMVLPASYLTVLDLALCRTSQLLILLTNDRTAQAEIVSVELSDWPFIDLPQLLPSDRCSLEELVKGVREHGIDLQSLPKKQRLHKYTAVRSPLAVSNSDLAIVVSDHRIMIYDLATDEQVD